MNIFFSLLSVLNYCVPTLSDTDSLKTFMKNNKIVLSNVIDGTTMVEWLKDSKEVNYNRNYHWIFGIGIIHDNERVLFLAYIEHQANNQWPDEQL